MKRGDRTLYYGLPVAGASLVLISLLLFASANPVADALIVFFAVALVAEGLGLAMNWRGGTRMVVMTLRSENPPSLLALIPAWSWRLTGVACAFTGAVSVVIALPNLT